LIAEPAGMYGGRGRSLPYLPGMEYTINGSAVVSDRFAEVFGFRRGGAREPDSDSDLMRVVEHDGTVTYRNIAGQLHRTEGPAVEHPDGRREYRQNGVLLYEIGDDGSALYRDDGRLHRECGPAVERPDGSKEWFRHGKRHRKDGPAIEHADGSVGYWVDGQCRRKRRGVDLPSEQKTRI